MISIYRNKNRHPVMLSNLPKVIHTNKLQSLARYAILPHKTIFTKTILMHLFKNVFHILKNKEVNCYSLLSKV